MAFNLVLDEPVEGDKVEEHQGIKFSVESDIYDKFGPFHLTSMRHGGQVFLQLRGEKQNDGGGCGSCSSC